MNKCKCNSKFDSIGYYILMFSAVIALLWIGIFKFTPTEAQAIVPLIKHHPLSFWLYDVLSIQAVSNIVGAVEILIAILLLLSLKLNVLRKYVGMAIILMFLTTLSFLIFTPGMWRVKDGILITDFFILKDISYLGFGFLLLGKQNK